VDREQRILQYLAEALELLQAGHKEHLPILGRLDNAMIAASLCRWKEIRDAIGEVEEHFLMGRYKAAERTLVGAVERAELQLSQRAKRSST
jgi:hypothetical protein